MAGTPLRERPAVYAGAIALAAALFVLALRQAGVLQTLELALYDRMVTARAAQERPRERVVLVGATEQDIVKLGWPASDATLAALLGEIKKDAPRAIGLDIYRDQPRPPGEAPFAALLRDTPNLVAVRKIGGGAEQGVAAPSALKGSERVGFADVASDPGGVVRRAMLFLDDNEGSHTSFPLRLALVYLAKQGIAPAPGEPDASFLRLGKVTLPPFEANDGGYVDADAGGYQVLLDFAGGAAPFRRYSFGEVLEGKAPPGAFRDRVVIVGVTAPSVKDFFETPWSVVDSSETVYGITLHAHAVSQFLRAALEGAAPRRVAPEWAKLAWLALWCALGALIGLYAQGVWRYVGAALAGLALNALIVWVAFGQGLWYPLFPQSLGWLIALSIVTAYSYYLEQSHRGQLMNIFSRYMARDLAADVWRRRGEFLESGGRPKPQRLTATVLFSDIKGFTAVSEKLDAAGLMEWLNSYMEAMAGLVMKHGGVVDKFIGDAVMAVFGVPVARSGEAEIAADARSAARCALAMRAELDRFNAAWAAKGLPAIGIRIGLYTGELISGSLGSSERMEYTVIGDTVNTASRLESFKLAPGESPPEALAEERDGACRILAGDSTVRLLGGQFAVSPVGKVRLKGKEEPVAVFSLVGERRDEN
ncbi:MAG TPA: adenylate/guanylate cyclase domain-containing protein [Burkholderiales bacterium]|jgi:adenylate cyclase|nr:adenylate/guanylate cyclase domain-containing protein [Burkholderiales bacterium]HEX2648777.1 adenylate/guanylate cyclase domain-containing protein [Burkholderiales bacterium]